MVNNGNLIRNGGFESGTFDYWTVAGGQIVQLHDTSIPGEYEAKFTVGESIFTACSTTDLLPVGPNREYEIAFDLWGVYGDAISYSLQECNQDGAVIRNTQYSIASVPLVPTQITKRHVTGAGAAFAILTIFSASEASGDYFYLNDISVFELNAGLSAEVAAAIIAAGGATPDILAVTAYTMANWPVSGTYYGPEINCPGAMTGTFFLVSSGTQIVSSSGIYTVQVLDPASGLWIDVYTFPTIAVSAVQTSSGNITPITGKCRMKFVVAGRSTTGTGTGTVGAIIR